MANLGQAITIARYITNDSDATNYARTDAELLQYANDSLDAIAAVRPDLFHAVIEIACIANTTMQTLNITDSIGLIDILNVKNGNAVTKVERQTLDVFVPGWNAMTPATAEHWMPVTNDKYRFEVYPPAPTGQVLIGIHVAKPTEYAAIQTHTLSDTFTPAIADYIVAMLDSKEDEHVVSGRSKLYMDSFISRLVKAS